jgi:predicted PurR-regulated permease PerM
MDISFKPPFYAKVALIFVGLFSLVFVLHVGKDIIIPVVFATILAILLNPLVNFLVKKKVNIIIAISLAVMVTIVVAVGLFYIISSQISMFTETYPQLKLKMSAASGELVSWISRKFKIPHSTINAWMLETEREAIENFAIGEKISQVGETLVVVLLLPVYLSMILFYKNLLLEFIRKLFRTEHHASVVAVLADSKIIIQNYLGWAFFRNDHCCNA